MATSSRRSFLTAAGGTLLALAAPAGAPALLLASRRRADLVIRGGTVFDGTGAAGVEADVAITGGRVTLVQRRIAERGGVEIDARGLAVAPGFVDLHSHADGTLFADPLAESVVRQGVTTVVVGQDGGSGAPLRPDEDADPELAGRRFATFGELFGAIDRLAPAVNVASMIGLGTVRSAVVGLTDRPATADELRRMGALVEGALADGACGASSGLEYTPGAFASRAELAALCRPLARRGLVYATHMRNEDDRLLEAIDEAVAVARGAGCGLHISHLKTQGPRNWGKLAGAFERVDAAARRGLDVTFDRYPYTAYWTGLTNIFPVWSRDGGTEAFLARVADPATAPRIRAETLAKVELIGGWDNIMISSVTAAADRAAEGARLGTYAGGAGAPPYEAAVGLLQRSGGEVGMVGFAMSEGNLERILAHPRGLVASDGGAHALAGPARRGHPHPRSLGTFPRVLARYVRERRTLTLALAIHKMTALPARRLRLADRGRLAPGLAGDAVVFDPATVADRATFTDPFQYPVGIRAVVVNGRPALLDGERAGGRAGRALRPGG
jgi:N-acyl-D-amino-acid deacylase